MASRTYIGPSCSTLGLGHVDWGGKCPTHGRYLMTCDDFEDLWLRSGGRCALCRTYGEDTESGQLHIDHDAGRGWWAVRGLLCCACNSQRLPWVDKRPASDPEAADYLANPWYRLLLARRGVAARMPPEPPIGTLVVARGQRFRRDPGGWEREPSAIWSATRSWRWLYHRFGPHNLVIAAGFESAD
jgi:hypothetical protein